MNLTQAAVNLLKQRYCTNGEKPKDIFPRLASSIAKAWDAEQSLYKDFLDMLTNLEFLPNSPCIRNAGYSNMNKACFTLPIDDSMDSIFRTLRDSALIFKEGGGVGYNFSNLREKGAPLSHGGTSSGPISFMRIYDAITDAVKQGGMRRGACCSADTRALTKDGWKHYNELKVGDEIFTFNPLTERLEFQPILKLNVFPFKGKLIRLKSKFMDMLVTDNHRVIYKSNNKAIGYSISAAKDIPKRDVYIPMAFPAILNREDASIPDELIQIGGWIITEGSRKDPKHRNKNAFTIYQSETAHPSYCEEIDTLFEKLDWIYSKNSKNKHYSMTGERSWYVPARETKNILRLEENHKIIPRWMLKTLSRRQLEILFNTLMKGDGHRTKNWGKFTIKSKEGADRFLELCTILGYRASRKKTMRNNMILYDINVNFGKHFSVLKPKHITKADYSGIVWCPTVENGFWICERNGYVSITGNSIGIMNYDHPDIMDFVREKLNLSSMNNFNLSVLVDDNFMKKVDNNELILLRSRVDKRKIVGKIRAGDLFAIICDAAWMTGDPGMLFYDRINKDNPFYPKYPINATNPCVVGNTLVSTPDGYKKAEEFRIGDKILTKFSREGKIDDIESHLNYPVYRVDFSDGGYVYATESHQFHASNGTDDFHPIKLKNLKIGDRVLVGYSQLPKNNFRTESFNLNSRDFGFLIGVSIIDKKLLKKSNGDDNLDRIIFDIVTCCRWNSKLHELIQNTSHRIPKYIFKTNKEIIDGVLEGIVSTVGKIYVHNGEPNITLNIYNRKLMFDIRSLLLMYGINTKLINNKLCISGYFAKKFLDIIQPRHEGISSRLRYLFDVVYKNKEFKNENFAYITSIKFAGNNDVYDLHEPNTDTWITNGYVSRGCGEQPLYPYDSCCLGSINLSKLVEKDEFNYDRFNELIDLGTKFLLSVNKITEFPVSECYIAQSKYNRIGLGVMGFADALIKLNIRYDSKECLDFIDKIAPIMRRRARKIATNSVSVLSIAPTGSLSIIANCSQSIEPIFSKSYTRHLTTLTVKEKREDSENLVTAHEVTPEWHLKVQSRWQKYVDSGVSKTINLPNSASIQNIKDIYRQAWEMGCKGITVFRDGCRGEAGQVMRHTCEDENCYL